MRCPTCMKNTLPPVEPMLQSSLPSHPWEKVGTDLFQLKDSTYLVVVDYYSRYMEIQKLTLGYICWSYLCAESHIFPSWNTNRVHERQWTPVHFARDERICREILFHSRNQQSTLSPIQWPSRENGQNSKEIDLRNQQPISSIVKQSSDTSSMVWIEPGGTPYGETHSY